jgi:hypothetical protein
MYSQNNEDDFLLEYFKDKDKGVLLEIGAYDSKTFSNSKALIEKGWTAYLVDASPFCVSKLFEDYKDNSNVHIIQSIITKGKESGLVGFWEAPFSAISSINKSHTRKFHSSDEEFDNNTKEIFLQRLSIGELLEFVKGREGVIDFLSIDIEGFSAELAMGVDLNIIDPSCICIEHDYQKQNLLNYFSNYNERLYNGENLIITRK